ncbi:hypothetical protein MSUIS_06330 [Mycoplasma suis KI3806]|uniref:Uncharacterized protein n=1 Tax=Mycoplasma suis (strain KI_3806) TaxID=708248 RepID=F0V245_MYCS3|nr:hypothetical protein [Mycoplasma suis]CBZ40726.1 hypothetical protein MSUIS_06330 [Mycoplasma suis KI3806]
MKVLKVVSLITTFSIASLGGGYGLSKLLLKNYVPEEKVYWESVWILERGNKRFCRLLTKEEKSLRESSLKQKVIKDEQDSGECLTRWSENVPKEDSRLDTEWIMRGESEEAIKDLIAGEPLMGDLLEESKYPKFSQADNKDIQFLKDNCVFRGKGEGNWVIVRCPKESSETLQSQVPSP